MLFVCMVIQINKIVHKEEVERVLNVLLFVKYEDVIFFKRTFKSKTFLPVAVALLVDEFLLPVVNNVRRAF